MNFVKKLKPYFNCLFFVLFFFLGGCEDKLNQLKAEELLDEANIQYNKEYYEETIKFLENFELRFPMHKEIPDCVYKRALCYYNNQQYAQAVGVFESFLDRYPSNIKKIDAQKHLFYCFYNQAKRYDRDYSFIEYALLHGQTYNDLVYKDEQFNEAYAKLNNFIAHYYLYIAHDSLNASPKLWIQMLWSVDRMIKEYPKNKESAEAYYRIIEFLCAQNNESAFKDAMFVLNKMKLYHEDSTWYALAQQRCLDA